jgi:hypothetical protein
MEGARLLSVHLEFDELMDNAIVDKKWLLSFKREMRMHSTAQ